MVLASLRRKVKGRALVPKVLLTANPANCWLKSEFVDKPRDKGSWRFLRALPTDNPYLPTGYVENLKAAYGHRPELLNAYLHGSWDMIEGANVIIRQAWLDRARSLVTQSSIIRHVLACDPARYGDDETVMYYFRNDRIDEELIYGQRSTDVTVNELGRLAHEKAIDGQEPTIVIDEDGIGGPILDRLAALGKTVIGIQGAAKAAEPERYDNKRAEIWWTVGQRYARQEICEGSVKPGGPVHHDAELDRQLTTVEYIWRRGRIAVEPKDEVKKRLNRSPDRAEAKLYGLWALDRVQPVMHTEPMESWRQDTRGVENEELAMSYATESTL
jgi:hypothetical protein